MNNPQQSYTLPDGEGRGGAIVFATNNKHKLSEIRAILGDRFEVLSLEDINCHADIPETANTLEGNAIQKARYVVDNYGYDGFADDTGLEVPELGGEPGVRSARYAEGTDHNSEANMQKLLARLGDSNDRRAQFRTVIALARRNDVADYTLFEASCTAPYRARSRAQRASATTPSSCPKATTSRSHSSAWTSRTAYRTAHAPLQNSLSTSSKQFIRTRSI